MSVAKDKRYAADQRLCFSRMQVQVSHIAAVIIYTVNNHIGLNLCTPDSICVFRTLSVSAADSICGKWTQRRGVVNKKGKNHVNYLKFSKASSFQNFLNSILPV